MSKVASEGTVRSVIVIHKSQVMVDVVAPGKANV